MTITFDPTPRQAAALEAAADNHNVNNRASLSPDDFARMRLAQELDGYATTLRVGLVPPYEFTERFQRLGVYTRIFELAKTDRNIGGYLAELREKRDDVDVFGEKVTKGLAYLVAIGELTHAQGAWICSLEVPALDATMPQAAGSAPASS